MTANPLRKLKVFLCHSSHDKPAVREVYRRLMAEGWIDPWLDEEKILPGQNWDIEIEKAVEETELVVAFLSNHSVTKEGYVQYELQSVLTMAKYKPAGTVFIVPIRLDDCPVPRSLRMWQYVDAFPEARKDWAYRRLVASLRLRAQNLGIDVDAIVAAQAEEKKAAEQRRKQQEAEREEKRKKEEESRKKAAREAAEKAERERIAREKWEAEEWEKAEKRKKAAAAQAALAQERRKQRTEKFKQFFSKNGKSLLLGVGGIILLFLLGYVVSKIEPPAEPVSTPTPELGVGSTMVSEKDDMVMVYVPAGEFQMGSEYGGSDEKPVHPVYLDAYWIDQTEVTNAMYAKCVAAGACDEPSSSKSYTHNSYYGNPEFDDYPVIYVSWDDANNYCSWSERRLPTEAEWEKAAGWDEETQSQRIYPWGGEINDTYANYSSNIGDTTRVGSYESGKSFYGAYDLAGNVWEWVNDWYASDYYANSQSSNPLGPETGTYRVLRGGAWNLNDHNARSALRLRNTPVLNNDSLGFRCVRSP